MSVIPCPAAQLTFTVPGAAAANPKIYGPPGSFVRLVAGWPFTTRSLALMPSTSSLNVTSICCNARTVAPGAGNRVSITGGVLSTNSYSQDDPTAVALKGLPAASAIALAMTQPIWIVPYGGWGKRNV